MEKSLSKSHEIIPSRCKVGASSGCGYFEPVTFDIPVIAAGAISADSESLQEVQTEALDEVSSYSCLCNTTDPYLTDP